MMPPPTLGTLRFGDYELDLDACELRRQARRVPLERQPMDLLILLARQRGRLVPRAEIVASLWGDGVFVDVDTGVNTAIRKVRRALRDESDAPRFVETVPGRGYRFIAATETTGAAAAAAPARVTLAVLPFANIGGGPEHEYLAEGFTEEAITALAQIDPDHLSVVACTSVARYKQRDVTLADVGRELGATYLVEGSMRAEGVRFRITVKLTRTADQVLVWSAAYDSEPASMLQFQCELSTAIAEQIRLRVSPERLAALGRRRTRDPEAYDLYLRGRHFWNQLTPPTTRRAIECYAKAASLDPDYSLAWSGLADAYSAGPITGDVPPLEIWDRSRDAAARAVATGPELAEAHTSAGLLGYWLSWDWPAAEAAYRRAIALDPSYALAHRMLGIVLAYLGRHDEARDPMRRARELDPLYAMHHALSAHLAVIRGDADAGRQFARQAVVIAPGFWIGHLQLAQACDLAGESDAALEALAAAEQCGSGNSKILSLRGYLLAKAGRRDDAADVLATLQGIATERYVPPYAMALVCLGLGETTRACEWLERAFAVRDVHLVFLPVDPKWRPLREDQRFRAIVKSCGFDLGR
jgi:TolB-like protein